MVSHYERLYELVKPTHVHVLVDGNIVVEGGFELIEKINNEIMIINTEGIIIRMKCDGISELGRVTSGVKLINLPEGDKVACIAKVRRGDESEDDLVEPEESTEDAENVETEE